MKKPMRFIATLSLFTMLVTGGFITAAQVGDVSILPMPSEQLKVDEPAAKESGEAADKAQTTGEGEQAPAQEPMADPVAQEPDEAAAQESPVEKVLPEVESGWTEEEVAALRELARERIAAREMFGQISEYLKGFWEEEMSVWLDEMEEKAPSKDEVLDSVDTWLEDRNLPESGRWFERWGEIIDAFADSTGIAVDDAKEIGREWAEAQRELFQDIAEDVKELREELRSAAKGAKGENA